MVNSVFIIGGGNVGERLVKLFESNGIQVKLLGSKVSHCEELAEELTKTLVLHSDGTNKALLIEEYVEKTDAFIAVTGDEESNILSCMLAKSMGVKETIARVNKAEYLPIYGDYRNYTLCEYKDISCQFNFKVYSAGQGAYDIICW